MPSPAAKPRTRPTSRRDEFIAAAQGLFMAHGVAATSVDDIVQAAGAAKGTFYLYFTSKDDAVTAVAERMVEGVANRVEAIVSKPGLTPIERLLALGRALVDVGREPHERDLVEVFHRPENRAVHDRITERIIAQLAPPLERIIRDGIAARVFRPHDARLSAAFVLGAFTSLHHVVNDINDMPKTIAELDRFILRGLGYEVNPVSDLVVGTEDLSKRYRGNVLAVDHVNLRVTFGEIYAFLGLNGAGKSTTIRMLLGMITPTSGHAEIFDQPVRSRTTDVRRQVGHLVDTAIAYPELTVRENLEVARRLQASADPLMVNRTIDRLGLGPYRDRRAGALSQGNLQRLALARALLGEPRLLVLDEPTNGLDPAGVIEIRELLRTLAEEHGVTVFMSSHILAEVEHIATRVGIVHRGRLIEELNADALELHRDRRLEVGARHIDVAERELRAAGFAPRRGIAGGSGTVLELREARALATPEDIATLLVGVGALPTRLAITRESLEDHFIRVTSEADRAAA